MVWSVHGLTTRGNAKEMNAIVHHKISRAGKLHGSRFKSSLTRNLIQLVLLLQRLIHMVINHTKTAAICSCELSLQICLHLPKVNVKREARKTKIYPSENHNQGPKSDLTQV
jgi:hypothetical protein